MKGGSPGLPEPPNSPRGEFVRVEGMERTALRPPITLGASTTAGGTP